ncbi:hypothetical protein, partial [Klebsiella pneumoniae]|uniref:hypothetical protein n=1 Tax=Klebsiella pneumoniae TaxID=573 RepID=UPI001A7E56A2
QVLVIEELHQRLRRCQSRSRHWNTCGTNTEEIFHFARRIKLSTHFIRFTYIPDTFSGPFLPHQTAISP